jgi:hypothetical protein
MYHAIRSVALAALTFAAGTALAQGTTPAPAARPATPPAATPAPAAAPRVLKKPPAPAKPMVIESPPTIVLTPPPAPLPPPVAPDPNRALPPTRYYGTVAGDELYKLIKAEPRFAQINNELIGSPILLRVSHSFEMTGGGKAAGFASAILAGSTLGLLPVVTNSDLVITYEIVVNATTLSTYTYRKNFTRSINIYAKDDTFGLGKEGLAWAKTTVSEFVASAFKDDKLAALVAEYEYYFPKAAG